MLHDVSDLEDRLAPAEDIFFRWLIRVVLAAILMGSAGIDDAPPLELGAWLVVAYVGVRVVMQFGSFSASIPAKSQLIKTLVALTAAGLLGFSFLIVATFVYRLAILAAA